MNTSGRRCAHRLAGLTAATLLAALAPALVVAWLSWSIQILPLVLTVTLGHTIVLGLPSFLVLESGRGVNAISAIKAGFTVGAVPLGILAIVPAGTMSASTNGVPTVVDGVRTLAGWLEYFELLIQSGLFGALAGLVFWVTLQSCGWRAISAETITKLPRRRQSVHVAATTGSLVLAILLTTGVFAIPVVTKDRTCHNVFRDGRTSVGSQVNMKLLIGMEDWPKLTEIFERFAPTHGMSIRNSSHSQTSVRVLALSLCTEQGTNIEVLDQRWAHTGFASLYGWGAPITVYELHENSGWQRLAADLLAEVGAAWPGKVEFRDGKGRVIPTPPELEN